VGRGTKEKKNFKSDDIGKSENLTTEERKHQIETCEIHSINKKGW